MCVHYTSIKLEKSNQKIAVLKKNLMSYRKTQLNDIRKRIHDQNGLITKGIETVKRTQQILELKNSVNEDRFQDGGKS